MVLSHKILVFPFLTLEQHTTFSFCQSHRWSILIQSFTTVVLLFMENYHLRKHTASWKESMINRLSNLINRNRSVAKISQVLCSSTKSMLKFYLVCVFFTFCLFEFCHFHQPRLNKCLRVTK